MSILLIIAAGIFATTIMTVFMYCCAVVADRNLHPVKILTAMLPAVFGITKSITFRGARLMAITLHYWIGVVFTSLYVTLKQGSGELWRHPGQQIVLFGILLGILAVGGWTIFRRLHPGDENSVPWPLYYACIFLGHIIFALVMVTSIGWVRLLG